MPIIGIPQPQLFAILGQNNLDKIEAAIKLKYPNDHLVLNPGQWLLVASGTTSKELSDDLGITTGASGGAIIIPGTGGYYGRAEPGIWEWLKSRLGAPRA
jgi:hypothetical protein